MPNPPRKLVRKEVTINGMSTTLNLTPEEAEAMPDVEPYAVDPNAEATDVVTSATTARTRRGASRSTSRTARSTSRGTSAGPAVDGDGTGDSGAGDGDDSDKE